MKLKNCLEIGYECGLKTIGESIYNIDLHAGNIFDYSKINIELNELEQDAKDLFSKTFFTRDSSTKIALEWINLEDDGVDEKELNL